MICDQYATATPTNPAWRYSVELHVAAGMACVPHLTAFLDDAVADTFAGAFPGDGIIPKGYFRSDRYVRAGEQ